MSIKQELAEAGIKYSAYAAAKKSIEREIRALANSALVQSTELQDHHARNYRELLLIYALSDAIATIPRELNGRANAFVIVSNFLKAVREIEDKVRAEALEISTRIDPPPIPVALKSPIRIGALKHLTTRTVNCLTAEGITTIGELASRTRSELRRTPNFGKKAMMEVEQALEAHGMALSGEYPSTFDAEGTAKNHGLEV